MDLGLLGEDDVRQPEGEREIPTRVDREMHYSGRTGKLVGRSGCSIGLELPVQPIEAVPQLVKRG